MRRVLQTKRISGRLLPRSSAPSLTSQRECSHLVHHVSFGRSLAAFSCRAPELGNCHSPFSQDGVLLAGCRLLSSSSSSPSSSTEQKLPSKPTSSEDEGGDVSVDSEEWVPPDRPLGGDRGQAKLYQVGASSQSIVDDASDTQGKNDESAQTDGSRDLEEQVRVNQSEGSKELDLHDVDTDSDADYDDDSDDDDDDDEYGDIEMADIDESEYRDAMLQTDEEWERLKAKEGVMNAIVAEIEERSGGDPTPDQLKRYEEALQEFEAEEKLQEEAILSRLEEEEAVVTTAGDMDIGLEDDDDGTSAPEVNDSIEDDGTDEPVDWLQLRRQKLKEQESSLTQGLDIPVKEHTFLTGDEIVQILTALGAIDINVIMDDPDAPRMGGGITEGMIMCTSTSSYQIITLGEAIAHQLELRKLYELRDVGIASAPKNMRKAGISGTPSLRETWRVVDCGNFIVHIQDEVTRRSLRLDDLWSGKDPIWKLDWTNEDKVDEYVAKFPVPTEYEQLNASLDVSSSSGGANLYRYLATTRYSKLQRPAANTAHAKRKTKRSRRR